MSATYPDFQLLFDKNKADVYKFIFLLIMDKKGAFDAAFQTFLHMGANKKSFNNSNVEKIKLFNYAYLTCEDYYLRKLRRRPKREVLQKSVYFPISDSLWDFLRNSFKKKAAAFLCSCCNFTFDETASIMNTTKYSIEKHCIPVPYDSISDIFLSADDTELLEYNISVRFEERSVAVENKLLSIRSFTDRAVIWIALIIIIIFVAAILYTSLLSSG